MRIPTGDLHLVDPDPFAPPPTEPNSLNICLDIRNNIHFSPRLCLRAIDQKLASTGEQFVPNSFAEFAYKELSDYVRSRSEIDDSFFKHLVTNSQSRTFEDPNYVNTSGSKVVTRITISRSF